jgi:hypothetical protein
MKLILAIKMIAITDIAYKHAQYIPNISITWTGHKTNQCHALTTLTLVVRLSIRPFNYYLVSRLWCGVT